MVLRSATLYCCSYDVFNEEGTPIPLCQMGSQHPFLGTTYLFEGLLEPLAKLNGTSSWLDGDSFIGLIKCYVRFGSENRGAKSRRKRRNNCGYISA